MPIGKVRIEKDSRITLANARGSPIS